MSINDIAEVSGKLHDLLGVDVKIVQSDGMGCPGEEINYRWIAFRDKKGNAVAVSFNEKGLKVIHINDKNSINAVMMKEVYNWN